MNESQNKQNKLLTLYGNIGSTSGLSSISRLCSYFPNKQDVINFLKGQPSYTLHKPVKRKFQRRKYTVKGLNDLVQIDLADNSSLSRFNRRIRFILIWIDCYSRHLKSIPSKICKSAAEVAKAIKAAAGDSPLRHVQSDKGAEFRNHTVQKILKDLHINYYTTQDPDTKAAFAEGGIPTLNGMIYRYLTLINTKRYINVLPDLVKSYNHTKYRSTGLKPVQVKDGGDINMLEKPLPVHSRLRLV